MLPDTSRKEAGEPAFRLLARFKDVFQMLRHDRLPLLDEIYAQNVVFEDPLHRVEGLASLKAYLGRMYEGVESIGFAFGDTFEAPGQAMFPWTMRLSHRRLKRGEVFQLPGVSHIRFGARVHYHRDYFDAGALLYERLPVLGGFVRAVRARV